MHEFAAPQSPIDVQSPVGATLVMPTAGEQLRLMHVHAHPDDESSKGAASTARYVAEGVHVCVVSCTGGERGDILNPAVDTPEVLANLPQVRRDEMARAAEVLGVEHHWLGFIDSGYPQPNDEGVTPPLPDDCFALVPLEVSAPPLVKLIRQQRPHVLTTYDENGGYPHPDHIRCHDVAMAAAAAAADPTYAPELGQAWQVLKIYYHAGFHYTRVKAIHDAAVASGAESPYAEWLEGWDHSGDREVTTSVACDLEHFHVRDEALKAHATQIDPQRWFVVPTHVQHQVWSTEEYELARTWVPATLPETDLFAGLRHTGTDSNAVETAEVVR